MLTLRPALPFGWWTFELELRRAEHVVAAVLVALALAATVTVGGDGTPPAPTFPLRAAPALAGLPIAAQASISAALGRNDPRYHAVESAGRPVEATNPRHGLTASFTTSRVAIETGTGSLSLALERAGRVDRSVRVAPAAPAARANRVEYRRGSLTEWYVNGPLGLEQGVTVRARPGGSGSLSLRFRLGGTVRAASDGRGGAVFAHEGTALLRYRGLAAWDARGRALRTSLAVGLDTLTLLVDDRAARYPLTIDPFLERATLRSSGGAGGDELGTSVGVSGDTIVVGAVGEGALRGAAYVFVEPPGGWAGLVGERARLTASDAASGDAFGQSVSVSSDTVVVGAYGDDGMRGAAYVFVEPAAGWSGAQTQNAKLVSSARAPGALLGLAVDVDANTVVAGAHGEAGGAAYVFAEPAGGWSGQIAQSARLAPAAGGSIVFGGAVAVSGGTVAVGAHGASSSRGAVYVFSRPAGGWAGPLAENARLTASDGTAGDGLGFSVSAGGAVIVAGAPYDDAYSGSAYVFERPLAGWAGAVTERARLRASGESEELGVSVAVTADTVAAGSWGDDAFAGAVYVFSKPGGGWAGTIGETERLTAADGEAGDGLGGSVGLDGGTLAAGASADDGDRGSARVFTTAPAAGDTTPPVTSIALSPASPDGLDGWYRSSVHVTVASTDPSGVAEERCAADPAAVPSTFADLAAGCAFGGAGAAVSTNGSHTVWAAARDTAGNAGTPLSAGFKLDRTPPTVTCGTTPTFLLGASGGNVSAVVEDGTSGAVASPVSAPADLSSAGWKWMSLTGRDRAGNSTTVSCGYLVGYAVALDPGLPSRPPGVNAGAAVPVRFALTDAGGIPIGDGAAAALAEACAVRVRLDDGTPGCARYDAAADRFLHVLKTPKTLAPGAHTITIQVVFPGGTSATDVPLVIRP